MDQNPGKVQQPSGVPPVQKFWKGQGTKYRVEKSIYFIARPLKNMIQTNSGYRNTPELLQEINK